MMLFVFIFAPSFKILLSIITIDASPAYPGRTRQDRCEDDVSQPSFDLGTAIHSIHLHAFPEFKFGGSKFKLDYIKWDKIH